MKRLLILLTFGLAALPGLVLADVKVVGRLGQTLETTAIYQSASNRSRVYYRPKAFEYLVVRPKDGATYVPVVMSNGATGYIHKSKVAVLPYNCTVPAAQSRGTAPSRGDSDARAKIANYSLEFVGTPYKWGGNDIRRGIDCSAFVQQLYGKIGIDLPRTAAEQALVGQKITNVQDLRAGDRLYFWDKKRGKIGHTGIYLGNGYFSHSSTNNKGVATDDLTNPKWRNMLVAARR